MTTDFATTSDPLSAGITPDEWQGIAAWYAESHSVADDLALVPFVPFMYEHRPDALKLYRRWTETVQAGRTLDGPLPTVAIALIHLHYYATLGYAKGILYEIVFARWVGATRAEVLDALTFAWINGGAAAVAAAADIATEYLHAWADDEPAPRRWPVGWSSDRSTLVSGVDAATDDLSPAEAKRLDDWYVKYQGEVPPWVSFLGQRFPAALKATRLRYERATTVLPPAMVPLLELHLAFMDRDVGAARRAARHAERLGVSADQLLHLGASAQFYLGTTGMDVVAEVLRA